MRFAQAGCFLLQLQALLGLQITHNHYGCHRVSHNTGQLQLQEPFGLQTAHIMHVIESATIQSICSCRHYSAHKSLAFYHLTIQAHRASHNTGQLQLQALLGLPPILCMSLSLPFTNKGPPCSHNTGQFQLQALLGLQTAHIMHVVESPVHQQRPTAPATIAGTYGGRNGLNMKKGIKSGRGRENRGEYHWLVAPATETPLW